MVACLPVGLAGRMRKGDDMQEIDLGAIEGVAVGHAQSLDAATGCTAVLCEQGAAAGVDVRGGAPGTRETDALDPSNLVQRIHAVVLAGGSAFGLEAATGAARFLEERGCGFDVGVARVPIVCSAVLFDLAIGDPGVRPDAEMGYEACRAAVTGPVAQGTVGAGAGATVGKLLGPERAMKGGLGWCALQADELQVAALVAVNALGNVVDPETGEQIAGLLDEDRTSIRSTEEAMIEARQEMAKAFSGGSSLSGNTTLGVVVTNADLCKAQCRKLASMAHDGFARALRPAHSLVDGDTIFALATGQARADLSLVGMLAARAVGQATVRGALLASSLHGVPACSDLKTRP